MRNLVLVSAITVTALGFGAIAVNAQMPSQNASSVNQQQLTLNIELNRAKNLARQAAERLNGGLGRYRAEPSMHGPAWDSPYVENGDGSWTFTFRGGSPNSGIMTVESVVMVDRTTGNVNVQYNGPIRQ